MFTIKFCFIMKMFPVSVLFDFLGCNIASQLSKCLKLMTLGKRCLKTCITMHVLK